MKRVRFMVAMIRCSLLALAGCGGGGGLEGVVDAGGTVTLDGQPVAGATVSFAPEGTGRHATALTGVNGKFELTTVHPGDGAIPGRYKITVSKITQPVDNSLPATQEEGMRRIKEQLQKGGEAAVLKQAKEKPKNELPTKYSAAETSGLAAEIQSGRGNDIPLELKSGD